MAENTQTSNSSFTKEEIITKLNTDMRWVERAILCLHSKQTHDEKRSEETMYRNGVGFSGGEARIGAYLARWIMKKREEGCDAGNCLSGRFVGVARKIAVRHARQLADIANGLR